MFLKVTFLLIVCGAACWAIPLPDSNDYDDIFTADYTREATDNVCFMQLSDSNYELLHVYPDAYFDIVRTTAANNFYVLFFPRNTSLQVFILMKGSALPTINSFTCASEDYSIIPLVYIQSGPNALHNHVNTKLYHTDGFATFEETGEKVEITFPKPVENLRVGTSPEISCLDGLSPTILEDGESCGKVSITNSNNGTHEIDLHFEFLNERFQTFEITFEVVQSND